MTVHFIGAGPGAADLLTLRAARLIESAQVCLYAGTYLDDAVLAHCPPGARRVDTQHLTLDEIIDEISVARLTERGATRGDDRFSEAAMEDRKKEGYF